MIDHYEFGKFIVNGKVYESNIKIINNEVKPYRYFPGHEIKKDDFVDLVNAKPEIIVIGTGAYAVIKVPEEIKEFIKSKGIKVFIADTFKVCKEVNRLFKEGIKFCALLHNTC